MTVTQGGAVPGRGFQHGAHEPTATDPVRRIVTRQPVGVPREATLREVARVLADNEIGLVLVESPGAPVGLVSERDLVGAVADGDDPDDRQVADVMTAVLVTVGLDDTIGTAAAVMDDADVRHVLVTEDAKVIGLVSVRDVLPVLLRTLP